MGPCGQQGERYWWCRCLIYWILVVQVHHILDIYWILVVQVQPHIKLVKVQLLEEQIIFCVIAQLYNLCLEFWKQREVFVLDYS